MVKKAKIRLEKSTAGNEAEALDTLNARMRRKSNTRRLIEADIEAKAKKRRSEQAPASAGWKKY